MNASIPNQLFNFFLYAFRDINLQRTMLEYEQKEMLHVLWDRGVEHKRTHGYRTK